MNFTPKTEQELQELSLLEPGIYQFQVTIASDETSKNGNDMIKLGLTVFDRRGNTHLMYDYLLEAMAFKLRKFCAISGLLQKYNNGQLSAHDCVGKQGAVQLIVQPGQPKSDGGNYPSKNSVKDYVESSTPVVPQSVLDSVEEDVPF